MWTKGLRGCVAWPFFADHWGCWATLAAGHSSCLQSCPAAVAEAANALAGVEGSSRQVTYQVWGDRRITVSVGVCHVCCNRLCFTHSHGSAPVLAVVLCCATSACSFESEISSKNQEQASLTRQRLQLEKEQKKLQRQQEKKVSCLRCCFDRSLRRFNQGCTLQCFCKPGATPLLSSLLQTHLPQCQWGCSIAAQATPVTPYFSPFAPHDTPQAPTRQQPPLSSAVPAFPPHASGPRACAPA